MDKIRAIFYRAARAQPDVTKALLWLWSRAYLALPGKRTAVPLRKTMSAVGYRVPVSAKLTNGMDIVVPWNDDGGNAIYRAGCYEPATVTRFESVLDSGMTVFDVGANVGQYTLVASDCVGPGGEVHSFEPDPVTFEWLERNVRINALRGVRLNQSAVFEDTQPVKLFLAGIRDTGSNSIVGEPWLESGQSVMARCTTLDLYTKEHSVPRVDVIKIDVEGAELGVLRGAEKLLADHRPVMIIEFEESRQRMAGTSCAELSQHLRDRGYLLYRIGEKPDQALEPYVIGPNEPRSLNVLAIPESRRTEVFGRMQSHGLAARE